MKRCCVPWFAGCLMAWTLVAAADRAAAFEIVLAQNDLIQFTEQSFMQNVFGNQRSYATARKYADDRLKMQVDFVETATPLTPQQRAKLELAGRGDIHRFFTDYQRVKRGMTFGGIPRDEWQAVWEKTQPLSARFSAGLHGKRSLLKKTIASTLDAQQMQSYQDMLHEKGIAIYLDHIRMTLSMVDRRVPLSNRQREEIMQLMAAETKPPTFYGQSSMHIYVVLGQMAKIPQDKLKPLFSEVEWKVVDGMLRQARAMERTLKLQAEAAE